MRPSAGLFVQSPFVQGTNDMHFLTTISILLEGQCETNTDSEIWLPYDN